MNKDKVYLKGYVVGHGADTLGYKGLLVQLENLDVVEIDKNLVHKDINEPKPIKLNDVIARIGEFNLATKAVWINEILNKLGSDYGTLKYKDGYEQGKLEGSLIPYEEPQKVTVPQFVADYIKDAKYYEWDLDDVFDHITEESGGSEISEWFYTLGNVDVFARAWLDGYEVEKEKRYLVKMKGVDSRTNYLYYGEGSKTWLFKPKLIDGLFRKTNTRKELEEAGFGEVFNSQLFEVEEVE